MDNKLKLSVAQIISESGETMKNAELMVKNMKNAKKEGSELVVFPELQLCNYDGYMLQSNPEKMAVTLDSPEVKLLKDKCKELNIATIVGACVKYEDGLGNTAIVIDNNGVLITTYDKMAMWIEEVDFFKHVGNKLDVVKIGDLKIGLSVCYDAGFPEHFRCLTKMGADIIVSINCFAQGEEEFRYHYYWPLRAIENTVYVVSANAIGDAGSRTHFGKSKIIDPNGKLLIQADSTECIISSVLTKKRIENVRKEFTYLGDIREDVYERYRNLDKQYN